MKLVNECRQPASVSKPVQPVFGEDAAMRALAKLEANGYYQPIGGSVDRMYEIAGEVADAMTSQLAPTMSLSNEGETQRSYGRLGAAASDMRLETAPVAVAENATTTEMFPDDYAPVAEDAGAEGLFDDEDDPFEDYAPIAPVRQAAAAAGGNPTTTAKPNNAPSPAPNNAPSPAPSRRQTAYQAKTAQILTDDAPVQPRKRRSLLSHVKEHVLDNGMVFEDLALKNKDRELQARWNTSG